MKIVEVIEIKISGMDCSKAQMDFQIFNQRNLTNLVKIILN